VAWLVAGCGLENQQSAAGYRTATWRDTPGLHSPQQQMGGGQKFFWLSFNFKINRLARILCQIYFDTLGKRQALPSW